VVNHIYRCAGEGQCGALYASGAGVLRAATKYVVASVLDANNHTLLWADSGDNVVWDAMTVAKRHATFHLENEGNKR
jgi:hypothetical protein